MDTQRIRQAVRSRYGSIVAGVTSSCCGPSEDKSPCCSSEAPEISEKIGYSREDLDAVPEGANLGLGCGNPVALASLLPGEVVVDLGSGAGFDCMLAAARVGDAGRVIGVDMTAEMIDRARENATKSGAANLEFRLGEIENLPVADSSTDAIISNCVINLSTDKARVFAEAFRILKPGGRLMVSDIVLARPLPEEVRISVEAYVGCIAGALLQKEYLAAIKQAGFSAIEVVSDSVFGLDCVASDPLAQDVAGSLSDQQLDSLEGTVHSIAVRAIKPE